MRTPWQERHYLRSGRSNPNIIDELFDILYTQVKGEGFLDVSAIGNISVCNSTNMQFYV